MLDLGGRQLPDGTPVLPELGPEALARLQAEIRAYALRYPDGPVTVMDFGDFDLRK